MVRGQDNVFARFDAVESVPPLGVCGGPEDPFRVVRLEHNRRAAESCAVAQPDFSFDTNLRACPGGDCGSEQREKYDSQVHVRLSLTSARWPAGRCVPTER